MSNFRNQLRIKGVTARGYGILPKMVMLDRKLSIEAKSIYSYFCSYAGSGNQAFPSVDKIKADLNIGKTRYYKHFNMLKEYGYIEVEQIRSKKGVFKHNVYTLVTYPIKKEEIENESINIGDEDFVANPYPRNEYIGFQDSDFGDININNPSNINNSFYNQSLIQADGDDRVSNLKSILEKSNVNESFFGSDYNSVKRAIESLYYRNIPLSVNNMTIPPQKIREDLEELRFEHIEMGLKIFLEEATNQKIRNRISYLAICIYNSIFDSNLKVKSDLKHSGLI